MRSIGCIWNDLNDKKFDILVKRTKNRLIATGEVTKKEAVIFIFVNFILGCIPLFSLSTYSIILCMLVVPLVVFYPFTKRITWWPQLWLGITFNWGVLVGYCSMPGYTINMPILLFYEHLVLFLQHLIIYFLKLNLLYMYQLIMNMFLNEYFL